jgi:hypothetical protein
MEMRYRWEECVTCTASESPGGVHGAQGGSTGLCSIIVVAAIGLDGTVSFMLLRLVNLCTTCYVNV